MDSAGTGLEAIVLNRFTTQPQPEPNGEGGEVTDASLSKTIFSPAITVIGQTSCNREASTPMQA